MRASPLVVFSIHQLVALAHLRAKSDIRAETLTAETPSWQRRPWDGDEGPGEWEEEEATSSHLGDDALDAAPTRLDAQPGANATTLTMASHPCKEIWLKGFIGRLGNRIIQIVNALGVAEKMAADGWAQGSGIDFKIEGFRTKTEPLMRGLFNFPKGDVTFHVAPDAHGQRDCEIDNCGECGINKVGDKHFCTANGFWDLRCKYGFEHKTRLAQKYLLPYLREEVKECAAEFRDKQKHTLVIHLRGGDTKIYHPDFHPCHSQPGCSIYDDIIENQTKTGSAKKIKFEKILLATDGGNPCAEHIIRKYGNEYEVKFTSSNASFITDACALVGARNVVWARSGFSALFMLLNPKRDNVFLPLAHRGEYDAAGDYCDVWNLNHGICDFVKEGYFYYPHEWKHGKTTVDTTVDKFAGTCSDHDLGPEPLRRSRV